MIWLMRESSSWCTVFFFFSSRRRHTRLQGDWSSDVCSSDLNGGGTVLASGTWEATELLDYQSYGCGIVHFPDGDVILPPNFCGGKVKMSVMQIGRASCRERG